MPAKRAMGLKDKIIALWMHRINWRNHSCLDLSIIYLENRLSENKCNLRQVGDNKEKVKPSGWLFES